MRLDRRGYRDEMVTRGRVPSRPVRYFQAARQWRCAECNDAIVPGDMAVFESRRYVTHIRHHPDPDIRRVGEDLMPKERTSVEPPDPDAEYWTTSDVAAYTRTKVGTISSYHGRGQMPPADKTVSRTHLWHPATIIAWRPDGRR